MKRPVRAVAEIDPGFPALKDKVIARTGHHYYADKDDLLFDRLRKRFKACRLADSQAYLAHLDGEATGPAEWAALEAEITIGETFFFRYAEQFAALRGTILPGLIAARAEAKSLRIWSAGCSTGAEPYSIAILIHELLGDALHEWRIDITGTDISTEALATARAALFGRWALRTLPPEEHARYFVCGPSVPGIAREGSFTLRPEFRRMVRFEHHNLMSLLDGTAPSHFADFDLILCRNVLIYFQADAVLGIVRALGRRLVPDGWLLIGHAEPNPAFAGTLQPMNLPGTVAYRPLGGDAVAVTPPAPPIVLPPVTVAEPFPPVVELPRFVPLPPPVVETIPPLAEPVEAEDPDTVLDAIRALGDSGRIAEGWRMVRDALLATPTDARLHYYDGLLAYGLGREAEAERALRGALYLDRSFAMAHYQLGLLLAAIGRHAEADRAFDNAIRFGRAQPSDASVAEGDGLTAGQLVANADAARMRMRKPVS
ncbi:protein-glutamate methyltransferase [Methylobacterium sp. SD274]|uniref:CheR family methyltransferase n=1 Tax=unclassified Methylobacterium TaxID=2615210 RepID=UPI0006FBB82A|nr:MULTISPECIES: CheR family methyltransferase [unclassified Methylobacterium]KQO57052.1 protein-glutamate methyltransferase [Methylobacterium sp. Leaf86]KQO93562.1 protein-glutamate methyltransferase [Methylobacterium sp. Leaf91]MBO1020739.1 protein-glutamate methyltransferase [Methylobacterium sp. SD274]